MYPWPPIHPYMTAWPACCVGGVGNWRGWEERRETEAIEWFAWTTFFPSPIPPSHLYLHSSVCEYVNWIVQARASAFFFICILCAAAISLWVRQWSRSQPRPSTCVRWWAYPRGRAVRSRAHFPPLKMSSSPALHPRQVNGYVQTDIQSAHTYTSNRQLFHCKLLLLSVAWTVYAWPNVNGRCVHTGLSV